MSELLDLTHMARRARVTKKRLKEEADAERVPCLRAGNRYLFDEIAVCASLQRRAAKDSEGVNDAK